MAERDDVQRTLELTRATLYGPTAAKVRLRARLAAESSDTTGLSSPSAAPPEGLGGSPRPLGPLGAAARRALLSGRGWPTLLWVGLGVGLGYWLGASGSPGPGAPTNIERGAAWAIPAEATAGAAGAASRDDASSRHAPAPATEPPAGIEPAFVPVIEPRAPRGDAAPAAASRVARAQPKRAVDAPVAPAPRRRLGDEVALLARVDRAIRAGEAALALALLSQLDREFPVSALAEERAAARVLAECVDTDARPDPRAARERRARAERFLASQASSVYGDRIRRSCQLQPASGGADRALEPSGAEGSP